MKLDVLKESFDKFLGETTSDFRQGGYEELKKLATNTIAQLENATTTLDYENDKNDNVMYTTIQRALEQLQQIRDFEKSSY